ncbi:MAG: type II toxin-antitoxin system RelE/ParE family toxin [Gemmatimonadaceae bacterium]|nr:type II toxin-antitoxin system RelE/ParE family toxin [Gemmatimonadaceae bacterium]
MKVIWSPLAEQRAIEAVDSIATDRPQAAADWLEELIARVEALGKFAKRGRVVPEIGKVTHRQIFHYPSRIIYRIDASQVVILTIRHGRRAWDPDEVAPGE